jgi:hypothetical protein
MEGKNRLERLERKFIKGIGNSKKGRGNRREAIVERQ